MTNRADIDTASTPSFAGPPTMVRAAVSMPDTTTTIRHLDTSAAVGAVGWLEVESSAVCGTDVGLYRAGLDSPQCSAITSSGPSSRWIGPSPPHGTCGPATGSRWRSTCVYAAGLPGVPHR